MIKAAVYIRVSTQDQALEDKVSLKEQQERCERYCVGKGYEVGTVYRDVASGATKKRPEFQRMLRDAGEGAFDVIVSWKADRLARGIYPCAALMESLEHTRVSVETVAEVFDRTTFEVRAVVGRLELENFVERSQMGREGSIKAGNHPWRAPYGYRYDKPSRRWQILEEEAEWVRRIFQWYNDGMSPEKIAWRLIQEGVPTRTRSRLGWQEATVSKLVDGAETYAGQAYYNREWRGRRRGMKDRALWIPVSVPAIISQETAERARARRKANKRLSPRNTQNVYLTRDLLVCQECGYGFRITRNANKGARLTCQGMRGHPHLFQRRVPKTLDYETIARRLWEAVAGTLGSEAALETTLRAKVEQVVRDCEAIKERLKDLAQKRRSLALEQDRVITWARKGQISDGQLDRQLRAIQAEDEQYATEETRLDTDLRLQGDVEQVYAQARQLVPAMRDRLHGSLTLEEKRDLLRLLVRRALLDGANNLTVEFRVPQPDGVVGYPTSS